MYRIAIDGPGGAGKSSVAKMVAKACGIIYVDTGALYRTVALYMIKNGIDIDNEDAVRSALESVKITLSFSDGVQKIFLCGEDVGDSIRTPEISMAASKVSAIRSVRDFLLDTQRSIAAEQSVIMDGRDIGSVILPDAEIKIFLTASPEARARRRCDELRAKGIDVQYETVLKEMNERDRNDSTRALSPCIRVKDAVLIDNSKITLEETRDKILRLIRKRMDKKYKLYIALKATLGRAVRFIMRLKVHGKENLPLAGGALLCPNHITLMDAPALASSLPRQIRFMAKAEIFNVPVIGAVVKSTGAIKVDRRGSDVGAIKSAISKIKNGDIVAVFPQGTRRAGLNPADTKIKNGAGMIAFRAHCPVIPVAIKTKNNRFRLFRKYEIFIGKPIGYDSLFPDPKVPDYRASSEKIFSEICRIGGFIPTKTEDK